MTLFPTDLFVFKKKKNKTQMHSEDRIVREKSESHLPCSYTDYKISVKT